LADVVLKENGKWQMEDLKKPYFLHFSQKNYFLKTNEPGKNPSAI